MHTVLVSRRNRPVKLTSPKKSPKKPKTPVKSKSPPKAQAKSPPKTKTTSPLKLKTQTEKKEQSKQIEQKSFYFPIPSPQRDLCLQNYKREGLKDLDSGTYSNVFSVCLETKSNQVEKNCKYVMKVSPLYRFNVFKHEFVFIKANLDTAERDIYFLRALQNIKISTSAFSESKSLNHPIVPTIYDYWRCIRKDHKLPNETTDSVVLVMDRWETNMEKYLRENSNNVNVNFVIYMFILCIIVGRLGIVHGDLKPDQFLMKKTDSIHEIVITDFGFSGSNKSLYVAEMGWSGYKFNCLAALQPIGYDREDTLFPVEFNLFQLEAYLLFYLPIYFTIEGKKRKFLGLKNFEAGREKLRKFYCPQYSKMVYDIQKDAAKKGELAYYLDAKKLYDHTTTLLQGKELASFPKNKIELNTIHV